MLICMRTCGGHTRESTSKKCRRDATHVSYMLLQMLLQYGMLLTFVRVLDEHRRPRPYVGRCDSLLCKIEDELKTECKVIKF